MLVIGLLLAFILGLGVRFVGLPPLVGFLLAGFVLKAAGYESDHALEEVAHFGVLLLLFTVGLKVRLKNVLQPEVYGGTLLHLFITALLLAAGLRWASGLPWPTAVMLAIALGFSSTVVAAKALEERRELRAFHGRVAIGILILQDLVAVALLCIFAGQAPSLWALLLLGIPLLRPAISRLVALTESGELLVLLGMVLALVVGGYGFQVTGLSSELGALVLGTLLAQHRRASEVADGLWALKEVFLVAFFVQIGMAGLPDLRAIGTAGILLLLIPLKAILFFAVLILFRLRARSAFLSGLALASYSEFALIVAQLAVRNGLLAAEWLISLSLAVAVSFAVAAPLNRASHHLYSRYERWLKRFEATRRHPDDEPVSLGSAEIVVVGMGRVGIGAYDHLKQHNERIVGLDSDPAQIQRHLAEGRRVVYADAEDPGLWSGLQLEGLRAFLLAMPEFEAKTFAARQLRQRGFRGIIGATNHYGEEVETLRQAGVDVTFNFYDHAGTGLAKRSLEALSRGTS